MAVKTGTKMSGEARREQVVQAALRVIGKKGMGGLTTAAIAGEVGMSEANLYRHFRGKDDVLAATLESVGARIGENFQKAFGAGGTVREQFRIFFRLQLELMGGNSGIPRIMFSEELHGKKALRERMFGTMYRFIDRLEAVFRRGQERGEVAKDVDPRVTVLMFLSMMQGLMFRWSLSGFSFSLTAEGMKLLKNFERCIVTDSGGGK
ncbi:MAG: TetR/AcrR family transcriptional regulator [Nitrospirota bacterium]